MRLKSSPSRLSTGRIGKDLGEATYFFNFMKTFLFFLFSVSSIIAQKSSCWGIVLGKTFSHINNFDNPDESIRAILSLHNIRKEPLWGNQISIFYQSIEKKHTQWYGAVGFNMMGQHYFDLGNIDDGLDQPTWVNKTIKQYYFFTEESIILEIQPRLKASTGFQIQYLWDESLDILADMYDIHTGSLIKSRHRAGLDVIYKKWDYGAKIGLNYSLSKHLSLILTYYHGLKRIDLPEFNYLSPRTNTSLGIGIKVKFSKSN